MGMMKAQIQVFVMIAVCVFLGFFRTRTPSFLVKILLFCPSVGHLPDLHQNTKTKHPKP